MRQQCRVFMVIPDGERIYTGFDCVVLLAQYNQSWYWWARLCTPYGTPIGPWERQTNQTMVDLMSA